MSRRHQDSNASLQPKNDRGYSKKRKRPASDDEVNENNHSKRRKLSVFIVSNPQRFDSKFPHFREPMELGHFSLDGDRLFHDDSHQLKYLVMPKNPTKVSMDLNKGIKDAIRKDFILAEKLDNLLHWVLSHRNKFSIRNPGGALNRDCVSLNTDFICYRGLLTEILCTPYEQREPWIICATRFHGTIYLCKFDTEEDKERNANRTERDIAMSSWGYKFEQYMVADSPDSLAKTDVPVNEKEEYCCVVRTRLNSHSLVYGAEMDGVDREYVRRHPQKVNSMGRYIELKTSRILTAERQERNFCRFKLLKWWAQAFLIGIQKVICGFRDDDGIVRLVRTYDVSEIPNLGKNYWSPTVCMNFCDQFLSYVKQCVKKDDPYTVYKFELIPSREITCEELNRDPEYQILPEWFISRITREETEGNRITKQT